MINKISTHKLDLVFGSRYEKNAYSLDDDFITRVGNFFLLFRKFSNEAKNFRFTFYLYYR